MENVTKNNACVDDYVTVCVHDGMFHADEVVALGLVMIALGEDEVTYIRSRNYPDIMNSQLVIDVGNSYDGVKFFDHHQQGFTKVHEGTDVKYSSAGLIWDRYCPAIAAKYFGGTVGINKLNDFYNRIVNGLILGIDAVDNGQYKETSTVHQNNLSAIVKTFNVDNYIANWEEQKAAFDYILRFVHQYLHKFIKGVVNSIIDEDIVRDAMNRAENGVMFLPKFIPSWKNFLLKADIQQKVKVCLVEAKPGEWSITSALKESGSMEPLCPAPSRLRGTKTEDAAEFGNAKVVFVHKSGYTGSFKVDTKEDAVAVARLWIIDSKN